MDKRAAGAALIGLIAITSGPVARIGRGDASAQSSKPGVQQAPPSATPGTDLFIKPDTGRARSGIHLLNEFFQRETSTRPGALRPSLDVIIATLPDPMDSHLDYEYDAELSALRQAFETSGYTTDRFWLPWPIDREKSELAARNNRIDTTAYRKTHPGVVLFRNLDNTKLRLLYIVGEVPTSGIHATSLDRALTDRETVLQDERVVNASPVIRVVGPAFTGGGASLAEGLARWRSQTSRSANDSMAVISGSATGVAAKQFARVKSRISYHATVHSDSAFERVQRNVLCVLLQIPISQIARLRESSTQFGASASPDSLRLASRKRSPNATPSDQPRCSGPILDIPFPANISSLRTEYARTSVPIVSGPGAPRIVLDLQDPARAMENPPVMSGLTPAALDVMLEQISQTLVANRIRAVGIVATDARDKLFLAEKLRARRRDLTLFTTESNVLLLRKEVNASLRGMLVFATYPLQVDVQRWDAAGVGDRRLTFANDGSEGIFNAARLQLADDAWLAEYGAPGMRGANLYCEPGYTKVRSNLPDSIPPIWVLAIGRAGFFPITACPTGNAAHLMPRRPDVARSALPADSAQTLGYPIVAILLGCLVWLYAWLEWHQFKFIEGKAQRMRKDTCMRALDWELLLLQTHVYALLRVCALLTLASGLGVGVVYRLGGQSHGSGSLRMVALASFILALTICVARLGFAARAAQRVWRQAREEEWPNDERRDRVHRYLDLVGRVLISVIAVAYLWIGARFILEVLALGDLSPVRQALFLHRAGELTGGYSPAMVLALTGAMFALWCSWHISRIEMLLTSPSVFEGASLSGAGGTLSGKGFDRLARWGPFMRRARTHLIMLTPDFPSLALFVVCLLVSVLLARAILPSYETLLFTRYDFTFATTAGVPLRITLFDVLARFGLTASLAATIWAIFRAARVWQALQRTLDELGRTPRVTAFERLPRRIARLTRLNVIRPHAQKLVRSISMTQWNHMRQIYKGMSLVDRTVLTEGVGEVMLNGKLVRSDDYLKALMSLDSTEHSTWEPDDFMSPKPPASSRGDETAALRFLFDLTDRAHLREPATDDLKHVLARTEKAVQEGAQRSASGHIRRTFSDHGRLWVRSAEELIAVQAVDYIQWIMQHLRLLSIYIVISLVLSTELIWSYALHPASTLWVVVILIVIAAVVVLLSVVVQMNRNEVLSRIGGTTPGAVTWNLPFVINLTLIALVPIVTFVGAELPWLREGVFSWLGPMLRSLGGQ